jgi:predicted N-acetyltransferase YhbS
VLLLQERNMIAGAEWGRIAQLYVQSPDRGRGIGRALIGAAKAEAARAGCEGVTIQSLPVLDGPALAFCAARPLDLPASEPLAAAL